MPTSFGTNDVAARGDRVQPPTRLDEHELEDERDAYRPEDLRDGLPPKIS